MENNWHYRKQIGDAGLNRKPPRLKDLGEHSISIFVREVIQNTLDAAIDNKAVTIKVRITPWHKNDISGFIDFIGHNHIDLLKKTAKNPDPAVAPHLKDAVEIINGKRENAFLIIVEEYNCIGLLGPIRETENEKSHFDALMRKVDNNEAKKETTNTGGTWGKGSSIFTYTSKLWTWFSYSYLSRPWYDNINGVYQNKRFMGRCMLAPFFDEPSNESYLGDGWFCDTKNVIDAYPFINEKADEYASKIGLDIRNSPGTTFFVPFFKPLLDSQKGTDSITEIKNEFIVELIKNWFIPIYNEKLNMELEVNNETILIDKEYLKTISELKFKLQLLNWYDNGCPPDKRFLKESIEIDVPALKPDFINEKTKFADKRQKVKSDLIIRVLDEDEDFKDNWGTLNKVALTRNRGMIVTSEEALKSDSLRSESILLGGLLTNSEPSVNKKSHLDLFLAYSENPAHNNWCRFATDYDRCFLDRFERWKFKPEASIRDLFIQIYGIFKKLVDDESSAVSNKDICSIFKQLTKLKSRGDEGGGKSLFFIRAVDDTEIDDEGRYIFTKKIISNSDEYTIDVGFKTFINSLEGEKDKDFEYLGIKSFSDLEIYDINNNIIGSGTNPQITLQPKSEVVVKIKTCSIDTNPNFKNLEPFIKSSAKIKPDE